MNVPLILGAGNKGKRLALLEIVNTLFKVYFQLNTLRLCKTLINAVNSGVFPELEAFPASQRVTYRYYMGRLNIFDEQYVSAMDSSNTSLPPVGDVKLQFPVVNVTFSCVASDCGSKSMPSGLSGTFHVCLGGCSPEPYEMQNTLVQNAAVEDLTYAFEHCPRGAEVNKRRCAYYLVPVHMLLGDLPKEGMLQHFNLQHYEPVVQVSSSVNIQRATGLFVAAAERINALRAVARIAVPWVAPHACHVMRSWLCESRLLLLWMVVSCSALRIS